MIPSPWCHCGKRLCGRFRRYHCEPGGLNSNSSSSRPSFFDLGKESSLSGLQWLVDSVILEADKAKLTLRPLQPPHRAWKVEHLASVSGSSLVRCLQSLWAESHYSHIPSQPHLPVPAWIFQLGSLKSAITLEETKILGHQRPKGLSINKISAFKRFKFNFLRKVPETKDYLLKHPKIAFTKKALCREINLNVAFHNYRSLMLY